MRHIVGANILTQKIKLFISQKRFRFMFTKAFSSVCYHHVNAECIFVNTLYRTYYYFVLRNSTKMDHRFVEPFPKARESEFDATGCPVVICVYSCSNCCVARLLVLYTHSLRTRIICNC